MNVEQDYIMRMIKEFANVLGRLLFNKKKPMYELDVTNRYHVGDDLYTRLCRMADEGKINEAENLLYEEMVPGDMDYLEMALAFYAYLNCFEDEVGFTGIITQEMRSKKEWKIFWTDMDAVI